MTLLTNEQHKSYKNAAISYICKENFEDRYNKGKKNIVKLEIIVIIKVNTEVLYICNYVYII